MAYEIEFTSVIRGHHVYKTEWSPKLRERLMCRKGERKEAKEHDECAVGTFIQKSSELVHMYPLNFPSLCLHFNELMRIISWYLKSLEAGNLKMAL